jgi:serine/threonine-protein kinase
VSEPLTSPWELSPQLGRRINDVCKRFEDAWRAGSPPCLEDYLAGWEGGERAALLGELVPLDLDYRCAAGHELAAADYLRRFPELAGQLQRRLETVDRGEQLLDTGDEEEAPPAVPASFGKYRVVRPLGEGGQASTLLAWDADLHCHVVLKLYHNARTAAEQDKVLSEGRALARVRSPWVARCHGVERQDGVPALVMEYVPGRNLRQEKRARPLAIDPALELTGQLAEGLAAVHACGLLHRDLKPDNVLIGDDGRPRLMDFGLAAALASADLMSISGTLPYMAPEQARGQSERIDARTDVYGLGAVLYELLTGRPPHQGANQEEVWRAAYAGDVVPPRQFNRRVPRAINDLCLRCLAKDPLGRFGSATELADALRRLQRWRRRKSRWLLLTAALLAVCLLAGFLVQYLLPRAAPDTALTPETQPSAAARAAEKVTILRLAIQHFPTVRGRRDLAPVGLLGQTSFQTHLADRITIQARLSQPAYAFLIAFRPDGTPDVCFPETEDERPPPTDRPGYPSKSLADTYGLEEGTGLQVFALVVSRQPLPPFQSWWSQCSGCPWQKSDTLPGVVWRANGVDEVEALTAEPTDPRGKGATVAGKKPVAQLAEWLRKAPGVERVQVLGFAVLPREMR